MRLRLATLSFILVGSLALPTPASAAPSLALVPVPVPVPVPDMTAATFDLPALPDLPDLPDFRLSTSLLDLTPHASAAATPSLMVPPRYGWLVDDGRSFWFAAGASSVVALGTHVLVGIPTLVVTVTAAASAGDVSPATRVPLLLGVGGAYLLAQTALASLTSFLVFNAVNKVYDSNWLVGFAAHVGGTFLGAAVSALPFGVGGMLLGGLNGLVEFTGSAGLNAIAVLSVLGALPAVVIGGIALIGVPALLGSWAMSVSATAKEGYVIRPVEPAPAPTLPPTSRASDVVPVPVVAFAIPGT